ncbi:MAG: S41 family peptidase [Caldisericia bacterium]|nr:S41 family peptidase [Caldisericia bacterium]MDD4614270.1 S41 family peptidase [Caldisericia bacterium]
MKFKLKTWLSIGISVIVGVAGFVGGYAFASHQLGLLSYPVSQFALHTIQEFFVDPLQDEYLAKGIVFGTGDPYSTYFTKEEYETFSTQIADHYVGIGVVINDQLEINRVFPDSPASEAGVEAGDFILQVNGETMFGKDSTYASNLIRGPQGTNVEIVFQQPGQPSRTYVLTRQQVKIQTIHGKMIDDSTAYIHILSFNFGTAAEFEKIYQELMAQKPTSFILDLRDNGGGVLEETQTIAEYFLPNDSYLFWTIGKNKEPKPRKMLQTKCMEIPFVILINRYSASASEVLSGAVQDYKTGTLLGETSFGKASIQRVFSVLPSGGAIKLTVEKYLTPLKRNIMGQGIEPDVVVETEVPFTSDVTDPVISRALEFLKKGM